VWIDVDPRFHGTAGTAETAKRSRGGRTVGGRLDLDRSDQLDRACIAYDHDLDAYALCLLSI
jgi:hypothetical protein